MSYIGQTSRNLKQRYWEHICYIRNNAQHILQNRHEYRHHDPTQTYIHKIAMLTPYEQVYPDFSLQWKSHHGTRHRWTNPIIAVGHGHSTYVTDRYNSSHTTLRPAPTLPQQRQIAVTGMYKHHYLIELIAFSAEINIITQTIVIL